MRSPPRGLDLNPRYLVQMQSPFRARCAIQSNMPEKSLSERLDDCESTENILQGELVELSSQLKAVEDENSQLREDIKDMLAYVELLNAFGSGLGTFRTPERVNQFNEVKARLNARYGSRGAALDERDC